MTTNQQSVEENKAKNESKNNNWRFGVVGNIVKQHLDLLLRFRWWDKSIDEINALIPLLTCGNLEYVRTELKRYLT